MIPPAVWLLLAATAQIELFDDVVPIPAGEWRYVDVMLNQQTATVDCTFQVISGGSVVRAGLLNREELLRMKGGQGREFLKITPAGKDGRFRHPVRVPGQYAVVADNREGREPARVRLRVSLDFSHRSPTQAQYLPAHRQMAVILISLAVFFAIVTFSARRLFRAIRS
jgi:hypothetical protein